MIIFTRSFGGSSQWYWFGDIGLLVMRAGIGIMFILHGLPLLFGGEAVWTETGRSLALFGLRDEFAYWGLLAAVIHIVGGLSLLFGWYTRLSSIILFLVMIVATLHHVIRNDNFLMISHPLEDAFIFLALVLTGPGEYSVDEKRTGQKFRSKLSEELHHTQGYD